MCYNISMDINTLITSLARGPDTSSWEDNLTTPQEIDWQKPLDLGCTFVINRAIFSTTVDRIFIKAWERQAQLGYLRSAYGFYDYRPGSPSVNDQAISFCNLIKNDTGEIHPWMDFEQPTSSWPALPPAKTCHGLIKTYKNIVEDKLGVACGLYTSPKHIAYLASWSGVLHDASASKELEEITLMDLWVAAWPLNPPSMTVEEYIDKVKFRPNIYNLWKTWKFWQYSSKADGIKYGMEANALDMNVFNGDYNALLEFAGKPTVKPPAEKPIEIIGDNMYEKNALLVSFDKIGTNPAVASVDFAKLKASGISGAVIRMGSSNNNFDYDHPETSLFKSSTFEKFFDGAKAQKLFILNEFDHNPMIDSLNAKSSRKEVNYIKSLMNGGRKGHGLMLTLERNSWMQGTKLIPGSKINFVDMFKNYQQLFWSEERLVTGARTGDWFVDTLFDPTANPPTNAFVDALDQINKTESTVPVFMAYWKKEKYTVTGSFRDVLNGIDQPDVLTLSKLNMGNNTEWSGWEVATVYHPAVLDATGKPALFRLIIWNGDVASMYKYFNATPPTDPVTPPVVPDTEKDKKIAELTAKVAELTAKNLTNEENIRLLRNNLEDIQELIKGALS
jgi:GH25 family lysozyme M1 (1,4-beta-N-acetylmuramidase)